MTKSSPSGGSLTDMPPSHLPASTEGVTAAAAEQAATAVADPRHDLPKVRVRYLVPLVVAYFALYVAWITPIGFSLAVRVQQLDPAGRDAALALAIGIPGVIVVLTSPLVGVLSDRTLSRFGRRRPWFLGGAVLGLAGSALVGVAPNVGLVVAGWSIAFMGYSTCGAMVLTHLSDLLPEGQRGKVAGFAGAVTQIGPIAGIIFAGSFVSVPLVMFLAPAGLAFLLAMVFAVLMKDQPISTRPGPIDVRELARGFYFNPSRYPNLGWVWISRAFIFVALAFSTTYGVYLLGDHLKLDAAVIAGIVASAGMLSIVTAIAGAIGSGYLSDRFHSRKPFLIFSSGLLAAGLITVASTGSVLQYIIGTALTSLGIGIYGAVDQAIQLDVLPHSEKQNGRYLGIFQLANQVPQAVGPLFAGALVALSSGSYSIVYVAGAVFAVLGALAIVPVSYGLAPKTDQPARDGRRR